MTLYIRLHCHSSLLTLYIRLHCHSSLLTLYIRAYCHFMCVCKLLIKISDHGILFRNINHFSWKHVSLDNTVVKVFSSTGPEFNPDGLSGTVFCRYRYIRCPSSYRIYLVQLLKMFSFRHILAESPKVAYFSYLRSWITY